MTEKIWRLSVIFKDSNTKGQIHKEWIAPETSNMICAELARAIWLVLAPYPQNTPTKFDSWVQFALLLCQME